MKIFKIMLSSVIALALPFTVSGAPITYDAQGGKFLVNGSDKSGGNEPGNLPGLIWRDTGRLDMGWSGSGGGNLEAYAKGHASRQGQFKFIYGGGAALGKILFTHFDGVAWKDRMVLTKDGRLGIDIGNGNEPCPNCKLDVNGKIRAEEIVVETAWPDYVFKDDYKLRSLSEIDEYIKLNGHLPGIPKAEQVELNGVNLGEFSKLMLEKLEEMTLHMIRLEKKNFDLENQLAEFKKINGY